MTAQLPVEPLSLSLGYENDVIFAKPLFEWLTNSESSIVDFCFVLGGSQQEASSMDTSESVKLLPPSWQNRVCLFRIISDQRIVEISIDDSKNH